MSVSRYYECQSLISVSIFSNIVQTCCKITLTRQGISYLDGTDAGSSLPLLTELRSLRLPGFGKQKVKVVLFHGRVGCG